MTTQTSLDIEAEVIKWLQSNRQAAPQDLKTRNLIEERILDSMQFLDFIMFLGELVDRDVSSAITVNDLQTVDAIVHFVRTQQR